MPTRSRPCLALTAGDPAGIGYELVAMLGDRKLAADIVLLCDVMALERRSIEMGERFWPQAYDQDNPAPISAIYTPLGTAPVAGKPDPRNAPGVIYSLELASRMLMTYGQADGVVTGPVSKEILAQALPGFTGQTELLAKHAEVDLPVMAMVGPNLKVALATTHLPLSEVPAAITEERILGVLRVADRDARDRLGMERRRWKVCGLNPHAGEGGLLGKEEKEVIEPAVRRAQEEGINATGPIPADTAFLPGNVSEDDFFLAMYHDQVLPVVKRDDFAATVNVTFGLPYVRTSVGHGTAFELAGKGIADVGPLLSAIDLAAQMAARVMASS